MIGAMALDFRPFDDGAQACRTEGSESSSSYSCSFSRTQRAISRATTMLGDHVAGEHEEAERLWQKYRAVFYPKGEIPPYAIYVVNLK